MTFGPRPAQAKAHIKKNLGKAMEKLAK